MKVIVNDEPSDEFGRPAPGETVGQFVDEINERLGETNRAVAEVLVDGEPLDEPLREEDCESVDTMKLNVATMEELTIDSIGQLGTYCHRFLDRVPEIVEEWNELGKETIEEYRNQVRESLDASAQVLSSVNVLTNLSFEEVNREAMADRAQELEEKLREADLDELKTLLKDSVRSYFEDLLETLQAILDGLEDRRDRLVEDVDRVRGVAEELSEEVSEMIEDAQRRADEVGEWFDLERVRKTSSRLTEINQVFDALDQAGRLKTMFPEDRQERVEETLNELREGIGRLFGLLEDRDPTEIAKTLRKEVEPHLRTAREIIDSMVEQDEEAAVPTDGGPED